MAIAGSRVVEVCKNVPATLVRLFHLIVTALYRLRSPGVEIRHPIVPGTARAGGCSSTSRERSGGHGVEKRRGRVTAGSGVRRWGSGDIVSVEGIYRGPATAVK